MNTPGRKVIGVEQLESRSPQKAKVELIQNGNFLRIITDVHMDIYEFQASTDSNFSQ